MLQQLKDRYERYNEEANQARINCSPVGGLFGFGDDPKRHPCHEQFYEDVGKWTQAFLETQPDAEECFQAVRFMLTAPKVCSGADSYWMMYAAHGWCRELVGKLDAAGCGELRKLYGELYPRADRMPVQQALYKALKKGEK